MTTQESEKLLRELVELTRVMVHPTAKAALKDAFFEGDDPRLKRIRVYANLDGSPQAEVADAAGVGQGSVSRWSRSWKRRGLVNEDNEAVFDIFDFFPDLEDEVSDAND